MSIQARMRTPLRAAVWDKSHGRCWYCGHDLAADGEIAQPTARRQVGKRIVPARRHRNDMVDLHMPSLGCFNLAKGNKTIEHFRLSAALKVGYAIYFAFEAPTVRRDIMFVASPAFHASLIEHNTAIPRRRRPRVQKWSGRWATRSTPAHTPLANIIPLAP